MTGERDGWKACEALAAEFTRAYVDIDDMDDEEERFGEADRARMVGDAAARAAGPAGDEDDQASLSDVD